MTREEVLAKVLEIVHEKLDREGKEVVTEETSFETDLGADSLDKVEVLMELEDRFMLPGIPDEVAKKLTTVGLVVDYVLGAPPTVSANID